jgi:hypothetical protein
MFEEFTGLPLLTDAHKSVPPSGRFRTPVRQLQFVRASVAWFLLRGRLWVSLQAVAPNRRRRYSKVQRTGGQF